MDAKGATMKRRALDIILTSIGALLAVSLLVAGGLLMWGYSYTNSNVHDQLAAQQIYFPTAAQCANPDGFEVTPAMQTNGVCQNAGKQLLTGQQARIYANDFIAVHLHEIGGGQTYSQLSAKAMANPSDAKLAQTADTMFKGTTLRGLLLEAYGFSVMGTISLISGIASFALALLMLVLVALGFRHFRKTPADREVNTGDVKIPDTVQDLVGAGH
jgi:hypothetical protein